MKALILSLWIALLGAGEVDFEMLFQKQLPTLNHLEAVHEPLTILFSATPGMGKSTLSRIIEAEFLALRISGDETRQLFRAEGLSLVNFEAYFSYLIERLHEVSPNRRIVLDRSIDRTFDSVQAACEAWESPYFLIRLIVPKEEVQARILKRDTDLNTYNILDRCWVDYERFAEGHEFDFIFDNSSETLDPEPLIQAIRTRICE
jgi:cytidylate kinase